MMWSTGDEFAKRFLNNLEDVRRKSSAECCVECCAECCADEQHENTYDRNDHQLLEYIERMVL